MKWNMLVVAIAGAALFIAAAFAGIMVCPKCGYENPQEARTCEHCMAELPETQVIEGVGKAGDSNCTLLETGKVEFLKPGLVEEEIRWGNVYSATGEVEVARLFFRNAAALDMLTSPALTNDRAARIVELLKRIDSAKAGTQRPCPVCGGTGKSSMKVVSLKGEVSYQDVHGKPCEKCAGSGKISGPTTADEWKFAAGRAAARYAALQRSRKYVPTGGAWIPLDIEQKLSTRQTVLLRRAVPPTCQLCMGYGRVECSRCKGTREIKCPNAKCVQGMTQVDVTAALSKTKVTRSEKCKVCLGKGVVACPECNGEGSVLCKDCNGTGELPVCKRCSGQGYSSCSRCGGTGKQKQGACSACGGEGIVACSACNGDGRKK